jgi:hypothetical protein
MSRDKHRLREFRNMVLRKISVPMRQELTGGWRKLHVDIFMMCRRFQVTAAVWMNLLQVVMQHYVDSLPKFRDSLLVTSSSVT